MGNGRWQQQCSWWRVMKGDRRLDGPSSYCHQGRTVRCHIAKQLCCPTLHVRHKGIGHASCQPGKLPPMCSAPVMLSCLQRLHLLCCHPASCLTLVKALREVVNAGCELACHLALFLKLPAQGESADALLTFNLQFSLYAVRLLCSYVLMHLQPANGIGATNSSNYELGNTQ